MQPGPRQIKRPLWPDVPEAPERFAIDPNETFAEFLVDLQAGLLGVRHAHIVIDSATAKREERALRAGAVVRWRLPSGDQRGRRARRSWYLGV